MKQDPTKKSIVRDIEMIQLRELELEMQSIHQRLEQAESEIKRLNNPHSIVWLSPADAEKKSSGKYRAKMVRAKIQQAIDYPADTPFQLGKHFTIY